MKIGVTHTQPGARLTGSVPLHVQSMMGWGTLNPEPSFGQFEWRTLDERVAMMAASPGATDLAITLCGCPDWMKGGAQGTTDWSRLEVAPLPEMAEAFAYLCARVAQRYPQVKHFLVWNEFKGMWGHGRWDILRYKALYNLVYRAIKKVRPDALIGGPYAPLSVQSRPGVTDAHGLTALNRWWSADPVDGGPLAGADFLVVDGWGSPEWFANTTADLARHYPCLPIWWAELHVTHGNWGIALDALTANGAAAAILWEPEGLHELGLAP